MRIRITLVLALGGCLMLAGCVGQPAANQNVNQNSNATNVTLTIASNSIVGGKNASGAAWITEYVIPRFIEMEKAKGITVSVQLQGDGSDDASYKQKQVLNLRTGGGGDILEIDGTNVGEFSEGGLIKSLNDVVGADKVNAWEGWRQIPQSVQQLDTFNGQRYGIPIGTDGRVLFFNKKLFAQAGLPTNWQPKTWADIISAGQALKRLSGVTPIQLDAGTAMSETTTVNGFLPTLAGAGKLVYENGKWQGNTAAVREALGFYQQIYSQGLGDPTLQEEAKGRDQSFAEFAANKIGILEESDYFWRAIISPTVGNDKMADRDSAVGAALIPAIRPGAGVGGANYVTFSGGGIRIINPHTKFPQQAWDLLTFMGSATAVVNYEQQYLGGSAQIMARSDVNNHLLHGDALLTFVTDKALPYTHFRPAVADYGKVSALIQQATADVVSGKSASEAAASYAQGLATAVGSGNVVNN